jgi:hypothetical protein
VPLPVISHPRSTRDVFQWSQVIEPRTGRGEAASPDELHTLSGEHGAVGLSDVLHGAVMASRSVKHIITASICHLFALLFTASAGDMGDYFMSVYIGQFSDTSLNEIVRFQTDFEETNIYVLSFGTNAGKIKESIALELEAQLGGYSGDQSHLELNGVFTLRWLPFPWDRWLDTSFAVGNGLSYASTVPPLEVRDGQEGRSSRLMYYILVEMEFSLSKRKDWSVFVRVHHRSSVFGLFEGLNTSSNFAGLGLRHRF